jgi:hypothetical protein
MAPMTMHMLLLPQWLRVFWTVILVVVLVLHLSHAVTMRADTRRWHIGHILMAVGMIAMYLLPQTDHPDLYRAGVLAFGLITVAAGFSLVRAWTRTRRLSWVWLATSLDMAIMTYMSTPADHFPAILTYLAAAYLLFEALLWLSARIPDPGAPTRPGASTEQQTPGTASHGAVLTLTRPIIALWNNRPESDVTTGVRLTLAVMSLSMTWMLVAMQNMQSSGALPPGMHM